MEWNEMDIPWLYWILYVMVLWLLRRLGKYWYCFSLKSRKKDTTGINDTALVLVWRHCMCFNKSQPKTQKLMLIPVHSFAFLNIWKYESYFGVFWSLFPPKPSYLWILFATLGRYKTNNKRKKSWLVIGSCCFRIYLLQVV